MSNHHENPDRENNRDGLAAPKKRSRKSILAGMIILVAGVIIGWSGNVMVQRIILHKLIENPQRGAQHLKQHLLDDLDLSEEQTKEVSVIVDRRIGALFEIKEEAFSRVEEQLDLMESEIAPVLDAGQKKVLHKEFSFVRKHIPAGRRKP